MTWREHAAKVWTWDGFERYYIGWITSEEEWLFCPRLLQHQ
jgi:hypothetical protein